MRMTSSTLSRRHHHRDSGVVSIEFAAVTPVLILMIIGAYDLARAFQVDQQALSAATWIVAGASTLSVQPDQSLSLSTSAATTAMSAFYGAFPQTVPEGSNPAAPGNYSVALSEVIFTNPSQPTVIWTAPLTEGTANNLSGPGYERSCSGYLTPTTQFPGGVANLTSMDTAGVTTPTPQLVADISYQYVPLFYGFITGPITFWQTATASAPIGSNSQTVCYTPAAGDPAILCPAYVAAQCADSGS